MNDLFASLGLLGLKPLITALLLPPVPGIALMALGAWLCTRRRLAGALVAALGAAGLWFSGSPAVAQVLTDALLHPPAALSRAQVQALKAQARAEPGTTAIVVLGGGREGLAPEYGAANLTPWSMQRLRYGVWLARATGLPVAFSGGVGHGARGEATEAEVAARIAEQELGLPLKWTESESRDTRENAQFSVKLLAPQGVRRIVLVSDGWHLPRAVRAFEEAARAQPSAGSPALAAIEVLPAPMGLHLATDHPVLRWMPTSEGLMRTRHVLREAIGLAAGS